MTEKHKRLLDFIRWKIETNGFPPSMDEMKDHLGLASKSGVHRMVKSLEERGKIVRLPGRARAIWLADDHSAEAAARLSQNIGLAAELSRTLRQHRTRAISAAECIRRARYITDMMLEVPQ